MTPFQFDKLLSASTLGEYVMECEFDNLIDNFKESECYTLRKEGNIPLGECYRKFVEWVKGYMYYHALVCSCSNPEDVECQLWDDYDELYNECT